MKPYLLILLLIPMMSIGQDIRNAKWGATKQEVLNSEKYLTPKENTNTLLKYDRIEIGLLIADLEYSFVNNRLEKVKYSLRMDNAPISVMKDENYKLSTMLFLLNHTTEFMTFLYKNGFDKGLWNTYRAGGDGWIKNKNEIGEKLEQISKENNYASGWNEEKRIEEISKMLSENNITSVCFRSKNDRTSIDIIFTIIDNLPNYIKERFRGRIKQLRQIQNNINIEKGTHWRENLPMIEIIIYSEIDLHKGF